MTILRLFIANRWAWALAAAALLLLLAFALDRRARHATSAMQERATQAGRADQQASDLRESITRTKDAADAAETIRRDVDARHVECLRHARNPRDC